MPTDIKKTREFLEKLYKKYNHKENISPDPLQFVYKYKKPADMEIVALLSAMLAYGRVAQIGKSLTNLFARIGENPFDFVVNFNKTKRDRLTDFKHRFNVGNDISDLLASLKYFLNKHGSIEKFFLTGYSSKDENIIPALTIFCHKLLDADASKNDGQVSTGLKYLLTDPARASACKRLNLFLRWMVRGDDVDTGLWKSVDKAKLIIPMDVHMSRISGILKFHQQKSISLSTAVKVTEKFAEIQPTDPVKYDFTLCRIGMSSNIGDLNMLCSHISNP